MRLGVVPPSAPLQSVSVSEERTLGLLIFMTKKAIAVYIERILFKCEAQINQEALVEPLAY